MDTFFTSSKRLRSHEQMIGRGEQRGVKDDHAEVLDDDIDGICEEHALDLRAEVVHRVENRGHVHEKLCKHAPEILDVPEENEER